MKTRGAPIKRYAKSLASGEAINVRLIARYGLELARALPISEISVVKVAQAMKITAGLLHYYLGGGATGARGRLTSEIMRLFFEELYFSAPEFRPQADWQENYKAIATATFRKMLEFNGVALYIAAHGRFRLLQDVEAGETDYGLILYDRYLGLFRSAGFRNGDAVLYGHILIEFITATAISARLHPWPGEHRDFLTERINALTKHEYPNLKACLRPLRALSPDTAFKRGLALILEGMAGELKQ